MGKQYKGISYSLCTSDAHPSPFSAFCHRGKGEQRKYTGLHPVSLTYYKPILVPNVWSYRYHSASKITQGSLILRRTFTIKPVDTDFVYALKASTSIQAGSACAQSRVTHVLTPCIVTPFRGGTRTSDTCT
jgi:hypothetical protein